MGKKKIKFMDASLTNRTIDEAEHEIIQLLKSVRVLGEEKIDVKISFSSLKEVKPWDEV